MWSARPSKTSPTTCGAWSLSFDSMDYLLSKVCQAKSSTNSSSSHANDNIHTVPDEEETKQYSTTEDADPMTPVGVVRPAAPRSIPITPPTPPPENENDMRERELLWEQQHLLYEKRLETLTVERDKLRSKLQNSQKEYIRLVERIALDQQQTDYEHQESMLQLEEMQEQMKQEIHQLKEDNIKLQNQSKTPTTTTDKQETDHVLSSLEMHCDTLRQQLELVRHERNQLRQELVRVQQQQQDQLPDNIPSTSCITSTPTLIPSEDESSSHNNNSDDPLQDQIDQLRKERDELRQTLQQTKEDLKQQQNITSTSNENKMIQYTSSLIEMRNQLQKELQRTRQQLEQERKEKYMILHGNSAEGYQAQTNDNDILPLLDPELEKFIRQQQSMQEGEYYQKQKQLGFKDPGLYKHIQECSDIRKKLNPVQDPLAHRQEKLKAIKLEQNRKGQNALQISDSKLQSTRSSLKKVVDNHNKEKENPNSTTVLWQHRNALRSVEEKKEEYI